jgi:hypothetical protein
LPVVLAVLVAVLFTIKMVEQVQLIKVMPVVKKLLPMVTPEEAVVEPVQLGLMLLLRKLPEPVVLV